MTTGGSGPRGDPPRNGRAAGSNYNLDERLVTRCYQERWPAIKSRRLFHIAIFYASK